MIKFDKLYKVMEENNTTFSSLRRSCNFASATCQKLKKGENVTIDTIDKLCLLFQCQPGDLLSWEPDGSIENEQEKLKQAKIAKLEAQIAALKNPK